MTSTPWDFSDLGPLLKAAVVSLLAGALAVLAGLYLLDGLQGESAVPAWAWDLRSGRSELGSGESTAQGWRLTLDEAGRSALVLPLPALQSQAYPLLHLRFAEQPAIDALGLFWGTSRTGGQMAQFWVPGSLDQSLWLPLGGMSAWEGKVVELAVLLQGEPGATLVIEALKLLPASPLYQLQALYSDWTAFVPWGLESINRHNGTRATGSTLYPVPVAAAWLCASVVLYGLFTLLRKAQRFDWRVASAMFIACWICLDLAWQGKLWRQLVQTRETFAGRDSPAKLARGPDAALVQFATDIQQRIAEPGARVLVASSSDYGGMRASYYMYPLNVFWQRNATELPAREYIHAGDYIALVYPSAVRFDSKTDTLNAPGVGPVPVRLLAESQIGRLYRVM